MQYTFRILVISFYGLIITIACPGCQQKMAGQPSYQPLEPCELFADQRSARPLVAGTVARGQLRTDLPFFTGRKTRTGRNPKEQEPAPRPDSGQRRAFDENRDFVSEF